MHNIEILIAGLLGAVALLSVTARVLSVPQPVMLLVGGAVLGFIPGIPAIHMSPELVLLVFLPPLLYVAAVNANVDDFRRDGFWLVLNSVVLVIATMCVVAVSLHWLADGVSWATAFVLGAIISPTDPLAASIVMRRLGVPQRLVSAVEGEGMFNDATALVAFRVAVAAVVAGEFSLLDAAEEFALGVVVGVAVGWLVGRAMAALRHRTRDPNLNMTLSLLTCYAAFVPADMLHGSGVVATVVAGLVVGRRVTYVTDARTRILGADVWQLVDFLLNAVLFLLIGLQLPQAIDGTSAYGATTLLASAALVSAAVLVFRVAWFACVPLVLYRTSRRLNENAGSLAQRIVLGWSGMRGSVSLAVALAVPLSLDSGTPFPHRDLIVFLTFVVIAVTMVVPAVTLPWIIRRTGVHDGGAAEREQITARIQAARVAIDELDRLAQEEWTRDNTVERLTSFYEYRIRRFGLRTGEAEDNPEDAVEERSQAYQRTMQRVIAAQRDELNRLRDSGTITHETMSKLVRELDLEDARLEL